MKTLIIGIDGAHLGSFQRGWTPFMQSKLAAADHLPVVEDLVNRGWFKVATGVTGGSIAAMYDHPVMGGTTDWTLKFGMRDVVGFGETIRPIWQMLNDAGYKVGIMNLPTVFPAPDVDGFFVCGGGGGAPVTCEPTPDHCYPASVLPTLKELGYIVDERQNTLLGEERMRSPTEVFERLKFKNEKRALAFSKLALKHEIDFGFVVFRSSSVLAELLIMPEEAAAQRLGGDRDGALMESAKSYYQAFDRQVETMVNECSPEELIFVSDHGSVVPTTVFNPNAVLERLGYQPKSGNRFLVVDAVRALKKVVPYSIRQRLKSNPSLKRRWSRLSIAPNPGSIAFSAVIGSWRNGVYINDEARFGGPVSVDRVLELSKQLAQALNTDSELAAAGVRAKAVESAAPYKACQYPDVVFEMPDEIFVSEASSSVFAPFNLPRPPLGLKPLFEGKQLSVKSSNALAANADKAWLGKGDNKFFDLSDVYWHVAKRFGANEQGSRHDE